MPRRHETQSAVNDLLGLSSGVGLLADGAECRLRQDKLEGVLTEEQIERLGDLFFKLHRAAEDVADFAREVAEGLQDAGPNPTPPKK